MKVILKESIERLGGPGDLVSVRGGFARNFLLPQGKALRDSPENRAHFESRREHYEERNHALRSRAEERASVLQGSTLVLLRQATESGHLYGSVTARDVAEALSEKGDTVARSEVSLERAIKRTGLHSVRLRLHAEVLVDMTLNVAGNEAQARANEEAARKEQEGEKSEGNKEATSEAVTNKEATATEDTATEDNATKDGQETAQVAPEDEGASSEATPAEANKVLEETPPTH